MEDVREIPEEINLFKYEDEFGKFLHIFEHEGYKHLGITIYAFMGGMVIITPDTEIIRAYDSVLEQAYFTKNYKLLDLNLKRFTGYLTRQKYPTFRQKSSNNDDLYGQVRIKILKMLNTERPYDEAKPPYNIVKGNFRTFLFSPIKNELTMFFYYENKRRKALVYDTENIENTCDTNVVCSLMIEEIGKKFSEKYDREDCTNEIKNFFFSNEKVNTVEVSNKYLFKLISWEIFNRFFEGE